MFSIGLVEIHLFLGLVQLTPLDTVLVGSIPLVCFDCCSPMYLVRCFSSFIVRLKSFDYIG